MSEKCPFASTDADASADSQNGESSTVTPFDRLRQSLSGGVLERIARKPSVFHSIMLATLGILLTVFLIRRAGDVSTLGDVLRNNQNRIFGFFLFTNVYVVLKGLALRRAALGCDVKTSFWRTTRTFCESSLIGLIVAKIASDVYKYTRVGDGSRGDKIKTILVYRTASIIAVLMLSGAVSIMWAGTVSWRSGIAWLVPIVVLTLITVCFRNRVTEWIRDHGQMLLRVLPFSIAALLAKIGGLALLLGVSMDGELVQVAAAFLLIGSLASMTQVPAGVGLLDAGYAVFLTKYVGTSGAEAAAFLISFRLLGPVYVAALGGISIVATSAARICWKNAINQQSA
ncbi:MAG: hypothetical protein DHS20C16_05740 [Phycisphaerae bacterium]|nr:MAG: hypothetical protein DHS20C16_05740 [Phycisphaerae bacterium]